MVLLSRIRKTECGVVNLNSGWGAGTHWVAYWKKGPAVIYYESYGLDPPLEITRYLNRPMVRTQTFQLQGPKDGSEGLLGICASNFFSLRADDSKILPSRSSELLVN